MTIIKPAAIATASLPQFGPTLASIVAPLAERQFLKEYWRNKVFHCPGTPARLAAILDALRSTEIENLLGQSRRYVILGPDADQSANTRLSKAEALEAYRNHGATLYFCMQDDAPLSQWTSALAQQLGEPPIGVTSFFAVRNRNGTRPHLDWNENFTIQLRGSKRWLVAPNDFVANPVSNWEIGNPLPPYADSPRMPTELPADSKSYLLTPGSVFYLPRGYLHQVTSVDTSDSLSLNMCFPPTPWAVVLCTLLSTRLLEKPEFRDGLSGAFGSGWGREDLFARLPEIMRSFRQHAETIDDDLRSVMEDPAKLQAYLAKRKYPLL